MKSLLRKDCGFWRNITQKNLPNFRRGIKTNDTFKDLAQKLSAAQVEIKNEQIKKPLTIAKEVKKSAILPKSENEDASNRFLELSAPHVVNAAHAIDWNKAMAVIKEAEKAYPTNHLNEDDKIALMEKPGIRPIFNFAAIVNEVKALQALVDLGTNIGTWEDRGFMETAVTLGLQKDIAPRIVLLIDNGIKSDDLGHIFTENPELFNQDMDDLSVRVNYLQHRKFSQDQISKIIKATDSKWFNFQVKEIDERLGFFQQSFHLSNVEVRQVVSKCPNLIIWEGTPTQLQNNQIALQDFMGFESRHLAKIVKSAPQVLMARDTDTIQDKFDVLHNELGYSHDTLAVFAEALTGNLQTMQARSKLLQKLGKNQYDPDVPNYVNPAAFALFEDEEFCKKVAKIPIDLYNKFILLMA